MKKIATYIYRSDPVGKLTVRQVILDGMPGLEATTEAGDKSKTYYLLLPSPQPPDPWNLGTEIVFLYKPMTVSGNPDSDTWQDFFAWNTALCKAMGNEPPEPPTEIIESEVKQ